MSGFGIVLDGKGEEWSSRLRLVLPHRTVVVRVESSSLPGSKSGVLDPNLKFAIRTNGSNKVGV